MRQCLRVTVNGRVQGVAYRAWFEEEARALSLTGWVRNRRDGSVEAVIAGDETNVGQMIDAAWKGPRLARVTAVDTAPADDEGWTDFSIQPTS